MDIDLAFAEYHRVTKQISEANTQLDALKAQLAELEARASAQEGYVASLGEDCDASHEFLSFLEVCFERRRIVEQRWR
jgi:chromosome segregation ATPase